jgi:O-antigen chain-terminating methyltransferase
VDFFEKGKVVDLGCGRGEFLELLQEKGIEAEGVDLNQEMVEYCRDKGLICHQEDLLTWLMNQPDESLAGIFSSQVIEHLPPSYLHQLIQLAYFKLTPGGRLILETVNPTSVFALVQIYFLDLSHVQPIHPLTLQFLFETHGFASPQILYGDPPQEEQLQSIPGPDDFNEIFNRNVDKLNKLLYSPFNYAVIGEKS